MNPPAVSLTFDYLVAREPRLAELRKSAENAGQRQRRGDGGFCANAVWYGYPRNGNPYGHGALRSEVVNLVGRRSQHPDPMMRTSEAYDVVYQTVWDLLPPCDHDGWICGWGDSVPCDR